MTILYGNKDKLTNLEIVPVLKGCMVKLRELSEHPLSILDLKEDLFGQTLCPADDEVLAKLQTRPDEAEMKDHEIVLEKLLVGSVRVLERQLQSYLSGELSSSTADMLRITKSAPLHNIYSEQVLGMTDHQYHRAPNATMGFIDGKVRAAKNKTLAWLNTKSPEEQDRLISFSVNPLQPK
jgi:hypothetical protein